MSPTCSAEPSGSQWRRVCHHSRGLGATSRDSGHYPVRCSTAGLASLLPPPGRPETAAAVDPCVDGLLVDQGVALRGERQEHRVMPSRRDVDQRDRPAVLVDGLPVPTSPPGWR